MKKRLIPLFSLLLCAALLLPLLGCSSPSGEGVTERLTVEPSTVVYSDAVTADAAERLTELAQTWLFALKGMNLSPAMRDTVRDFTVLRFLPAAAAAGVDGAALASVLSALETLPTAPVPADLFGLYERLSVILTVRTAGNFLYAVCELALTYYAEEYAALAADSPIFEEEAQRSAARLSVLRDGLGAQRFGDLLSILMLGGALLYGALPTDTDGAEDTLHPSELLKILQHHADYYLSLSFTDAECRAFGDVLSFLLGELTSDRATPVTATLCELADACALSGLFAALPQAISLYAALSHALTGAEIEKIQSGDTAPLLSALPRVRAQLASLIAALDAARCLPSDGDRARIAALGLQEQFEAYAAALPSGEALLAAIDGDDPAVLTLLQRYLQSLAPALYFLYTEGSTP